MSPLMKLAVLAQMTATMFTAKVRQAAMSDERGSTTVEKIIITVVVAGLAIAVGAAITGLVNSKIAEMPK